MFAFVAVIPSVRLGVIVGVLTSAALCGCHAKKPLDYRPPDSHLKPGGFVFACEPTKDYRRNRYVDEVLQDPPAKTLDAAIQGEIAASGFAERIEVLPGSAQPTMDQLRSQGITFLIEPVLEVMDWGVPGTDGKEAMTTSFRIFRAGTMTEVEARTEFSVRMYDLTAKQTVTKTYRGTAKTQMALLGSDTSESVSRMVSQALRIALYPFWGDFATFVRQRQAK